MGIQQLQSEKLNLIAWISQIEDFSIIEKVKLIKSAEEKCLLSEPQKRAIDESLASVAIKGTISNKKVMAEAKTRFPHLFN
jgi:hypothetical protein